MSDPIGHLAHTPYPPDWSLETPVADPSLPPGVPPLAPPRCWCERDLRPLNPGSDQAKCVGCGLVSQICTCRSLTEAS